MSAMTTESGGNCYEILGDIRPVMSEVLGEQDTAYFVMGGMAVKPLTSRDVRFDRGQRLITPDPNEPLHIDQFRENGTPRDADVFVFTTDEELLADAKDALVEHVHDNLVVSVFGLKKHAEHVADASKRLLLDFTSDRTMDENGVVRYVLGREEQIVPASSFEQWHLELPDNVKLPVMHPLATLLCYRIRSISGIRAKDATKVAEMAAIVEYDFGVEMEDYGMFYQWKQFAKTIDAMKDGTVGDTRAEQLVNKYKARGLAFLENNPRVVDLAQSDFMQERVLQRFVGQQ